MQVLHIRLSARKILEYLFCALLLLPFLVPAGVTEMLMMAGGGLARINALFYYARFGVAFAAAVLLIVNRVLPSSVTVAYSLYYAYILFICLLRRVDATSALDELMMVLGFSLVLECFARIDLTVFFNTVLFLLGLSIAINFVTLILFPDTIYINNNGWSQNWFLGYRNCHIFVYLPWLMFLFIKSYQKHGRFTWTMVALTGGFVWAIYRSKSATSLVAIVVFFVLCLVTMKIKRIPVPNVRLVLFFVALLSYAIIVLRIQEYFADVLAQLFDRDVTTVTGRTMIWAKYMGMFLKHPVFGNGHYEFQATGWLVTQAHNTLLNLLVSGGIVGFLLFCLVFAMAGKRLSKARKHPYTKIVLICLASYLVEFLMEEYKIPQLLFLILFVAFHIDRIILLYPLQKEKERIRIVKHRAVLQRKAFE